jgi:hypothetical protein
MPHGGRWLGAVACLTLIVASFAAAGEATPPLHERIDVLIEAAQEGPLAAPATDAEFLRRATLDLNGTIPTADEARAFLDDPSPYKRERLIDRLLASPEYARRMATVFDVMLMERRRDQHVPGPVWEEYLRAGFAANKPYDQLVREMLSADGSEADPLARAPAKFTLDREGEPHTIVRDIGRMFLGRDMQCAQCHDHPLVDDYKQAHYFGLFAFYSRTTLAGNALGEKADGDVSFSSVFKKGVTHQTGPRVLDGPEVSEPEVVKGQEYWVYPEGDARPIPKQSRRALLAERLASPEVPEFARNLANRLWALMMGRGLVEPLDMQSADNAASHPELLDLLANELVASGFDVRHFLRELAFTRTYGRSSELPPGAEPDDLPPWSFASAALKPLTPEQLGWSVMQATGIVAANRAAVERQLLELDPKLHDLTSLDDARRRFAAELVEKTLYDRLKGNLNPFVHQYGGAAGQPQDSAQATVHQALFLSNGQPLQSWIAPSGDNLTGRLAKLTDASDLAEELYLAVLTRRPSAEERSDVVHYLDERGPDARAQAIGELAWALLASAEFRFNH